MKTKSLLKSKTVWLNLLALAALLLPVVRTWLEANPVEPTAALVAANLLLRFLTKDAIALFPATGTADGGEHGQPLFAWALLAGLAGFFGLSLPACSAPGGPPVKACYQDAHGNTVCYSTTEGVTVTVDRRSSK